MSKIKISGDEWSETAIFPRITLSIKDEFCRNEPDDIECIASKEHESLLHESYVTLFANRKRFDQLNYSSDSPVIRESFMQWIPIAKS